MLPAPPRPEDCIWDMVGFALCLRGVVGWGLVYYGGMVWSPRLLVAC
jgi:hypothetical protein